MREIIFRGKYEGKWVYGSLHIVKPTEGILEPLHYYICPLEVSDVYRVDPSTVGQYTGLKDKNGKEIYEGDIVCYNGGKTPSRAKMVVKWEDESLLYSLSAYKEAWAYELGECFPSILEIIGNIHDNPNC